MINAVGITGTHVGGTGAQLATLREFLIALGAKKLHHGDCIGVDMQAAVMAKRFGTYIVSHPPLEQRRRAFAPSDEIREQKDFIVRDRDIVDEVDVMIGVPQTAGERLRSGTWTTIRYAVKVNRTTYLITPDGALSHYWGKL